MSVTTNPDQFWEDLARRQGRRVPREQATSAELVELLTLDPGSQFDRGRLKARRSMLSGADRQLVDQVLGLSEPIEAPAPPPTHPMVLDRLPKRRPLSPGDLALLDQVRAQAPSGVSDDDARIVAELEAAAETSADRRLVEQVAAPLRRHHDRRIEEVQLRATVAEASRQVGWRSLEPSALPVLAERMADEARAQLLNELDGAGVGRETLQRLQDDAAALAQHGARDVLEGAWRSAAAERTTRKAAAEFRLSELALGKPPKSSAVDYADAQAVGDAMDAGRGRARAQLDARSSPSDIADAFPQPATTVGAS